MFCIRAPFHHALKTWVDSAARPPCCAESYGFQQQHGGRALSQINKRRGDALQYVHAMLC